MELFVRRVSIIFATTGVARCMRLIMSGGMNMVQVIISDVILWNLIIAANRVDGMEQAVADQVAVAAAVEVQIIWITSTLE